MALCIEKLLKNAINIRIFKKIIGATREIAAVIGSFFWILEAAAMHCVSLSTMLADVKFSWT
jgi:hypothetical protein